MAKKTRAEVTLERLKSRWEDTENVNENEIRLVRLLTSGKMDLQSLLAHVARLEHSSFTRAILRATSEGRLDTPAFQNLWKIFKADRFSEDGAASIADANWLEDPRFVDAYHAGKAISVWVRDIRWRAYVLMNCADRATRLEGDFVECGVDRGGTATCVINYVGCEAFADRKFYLFDTFQGLVADQLTDDEKSVTRIVEDRYPDVLEQVRKNFDPYDFTEIVPGPVPDTLGSFVGEKVAYLHIDMNVAYPECAALEFFWPMLSAGAPVIFDDYGFPSHKHQRDALDQLAKKLGSTILMLPTCQGLMWKT